MGSGAWVKQLFYGISAATTAPQPCWIDYVNAAYDRGLKPVIRLAGVHGGSFWHKPQPDGPGNYTSVAQAFARVAAQLPWRDGHMLTIQLWNEPNLNLEWGGAADPTEYGQFLEQTASAIRTATGGDPRLVIMNGPLSPGGDIAPETFLQQMFAGVPNSRWAFDVWAAHSYPGNYPPDLNIHRGQAVRNDMTIDSYVPQAELLAAYGRAVVPIFLSETGYLLGQQLDRRYPPVTEANRADYTCRAFEYYWRAWPELIGVAPFELLTPMGFGAAGTGWRPTAASTRSTAACWRWTNLIPTRPASSPSRSRRARRALPASMPARSRSAPTTLASRRKPASPRSSSARRLLRSHPRRRHRRP